MLIPSPWRADFPAIAALQRQDQVYLDSAATTQKPQALIDALAHYYSNGAANVHRAQHLPGAHATQAFEDSRSKTGQWLNVGDSGQIVFTHGATSALNLLAYGLEACFQPGDEIQTKTVRFRMLGCWPVTGAIESDATDLRAVVDETLRPSSSERQRRISDGEDAARSSRRSARAISDQGG